MARADSTINVAITGDAKDLGKAIDGAEKKVGGFGGKVGKLGGLIAGAFAVDAVVDFAKTALEESDRVGDALTVLETQLGTDITNALDEASTGFANLGLSRGDVLELQGTVADFATSLGLAKDNIAELAPDLVTAAGAMSLISDKSPDEIIDLINKAAGGAKKPLKELGIELSEAAVEQQAMLDTGKTLPGQLTDTEKAAARYKLIMEKLEPKITAVTEATPDLEANQKELEARFETLTGQIGDELAPVLQDIIHDFIELGEWLLDTLGKVGDFATEILDLAADITGTVLGAFDDLLGVVGDLAGALGDLLALDFGALVDRLNGVEKAGDDASDSVTGLGRGSDDQLPSGGNPPAGWQPVSNNVTINVPPTGMQTEQAVVRALRDYQQRNGALP